MKIIDLSHTIEDGMITYKGLPAPVISNFMSREESQSHYDEGTSFHIGRIEMVANTGTYIDSPFHRYKDGGDLSDLPLASLVNLDGIVVDIPDNVRAINEKYFENLELKDKAILINTGWDKNWRTDQYFLDHPFLTRSAAEYLSKAGVKIVGIDSYNIDDTADGTRPAHSLLLKAGVPIIEHMCNISSLPKSDFKFFAAPVKIKSFGSFPVRAFGIIE